jgi:hypothetical protein
MIIMVSINASMCTLHNYDRRIFFCNKLIIHKQMFFIFHDLFKRIPCTKLSWNMFGWYYWSFKSRISFQRCLYATIHFLMHNYPMFCTSTCFFIIMIQLFLEQVMGFFLHLVYILNVLEFTNYYDKQEGLMWIYEINKRDFIYIMNKTQLNAFLLMVLKLSLILLTMCSFSTW